MFSSIMNYFVAGSGEETNDGQDNTQNKQEQQADSTESELEKLKRQNEQIREQLEQKLILSSEGTNDNFNIDLGFDESVSLKNLNSQNEAILKLIDPEGQGHNTDGKAIVFKTSVSKKERDKLFERKDSRQESALQKQSNSQTTSNIKLQFQQSQSMKKGKSIQKSEKKMDSSIKANKKLNDSQKARMDQTKDNSNYSGANSFELDQIQVHSSQIQSLKENNNQNGDGKNQDEGSSTNQESAISSDLISLQSQKHAVTNSERKHSNNEIIGDPITGVLKHKINKNTKKTKEVSLTLNHSNIQQLVQLLQSHSNEGKKDMPELLEHGDDHSHQQALNLIMQLITNNVHQSLSDQKEFPNMSQSAIPQGIDPQILQQLYYIDKEEEECSDSDENDDDAESDDDEDAEDSEEEDDDDDSQDSDEDDSQDDQDDQIDPQHADHDDNIQQIGIQDYDDEVDFDSELNEHQKQNNQISVQESPKSSRSSQRLQNQLNRQKLAKKKDANQLYNQSSSDSNDNLARVDLLSYDADKSQKQSQNPQRVKDKLQKRKKQLEAQKAQLQHLQQQQKLQQKIQKKRQKRQEDENDHQNSNEVQKGPNNVKKYSEDISNSKQKDQGGDDLQCEEQYTSIDQEVNKSKQLDTTTVDGDNSSQYEDLEYDSEQTSSQKQQFLNDQKGDYNQQNQQNLQKLLKQKLVISQKLSPQFHRFYENFLQNIEYIIQYEYNILPEQKFYQNFGQNTNLSNLVNNQYYLADQRARDAAESILKKKYDNLRKLCEQNCKCFTGPHSVLQIFIEKIVVAVESFSSKLKVLARDDLQLWVEDNQFNSDEFQSDENDVNLNELNYSINGIDLNTIFKMQKLQQTQGLKNGFKQGLKDGLSKSNSKIGGPTSSVEHKLKQIEMNTKSEEAKEKLRALGQMTDNEIQHLVYKAGEYLKNKRNSKKFRPLLKNLPNYTNFLQNVICHYNLIINNYAPAISRHFTEMTQVIKEGNQYEFPSQDIHRTIINKLIINDQNLFRHFFQHIRQEYIKNEKQIKKKISQAQSQKNQNQPQTLLKDCGKDGSINGISKSTQNLIKFVEIFEQFVKDVEADINKGVQQLNIDFYMRDLRKHALEEYDEIHSIEQALISKDAFKPIVLNENQDGEQPDFNEKLNQRYGFMLDAKEKKKLKKKQRKRDKKAKQQQAIIGGASDQEETSAGNIQKELDEDIQLSPEVFKKQYDINEVINFDLDDIKNLSNKKKKGKSGGKLSQEEIKNLSTDELLSYIESEGKNKQKGALLEASQKVPQGSSEDSNQQQFIHSETKSISISPSEQVVLGESKQMLQMRAKAKAFIEQQQKKSSLNSKKSSDEKVLDPNNFTCKFCNGSVNSKSNKFVHEKFCLVASHPSSDKTQNWKSLNDKTSKTKKVENSGQKIETSTQSSSLQKDKNAELYDEEDQHIEEFARKLEMIQKIPQIRHNGSGGQRRRKKLKPNVSKDWVNKLRKTLKSQTQSSTPCTLKDLSHHLEVADSSDSMGSYTSSSNSTMTGNQCSSEAQLQKKRTKLSDLTQDQIQLQDMKKNETVKFNSQKLNLSVSASQNRKKIQAQAKKDF